MAVGKWVLVVVLLMLVPSCQTTGGSVSVNMPGERLEKDRGGPPDHAPAHGYRKKFRYRYYPDAYVYFDLDRGVYFYLDSNNWKKNSSLPYELKIRLGNGVEIEMDSESPYIDFEGHKGKYPPGQMKNKEKDKQKKDKKKD